MVYFFSGGVGVEQGLNLGVVEMRWRGGLGL